jgi:hypothetical protein
VAVLVLVEDALVESVVRLIDIETHVASHADGLARPKGRPQIRQGRVRGMVRDPMVRVVAAVVDAIRRRRVDPDRLVVSVVDSVSSMVGCAANPAKARPASPIQVKLVRRVLERVVVTIRATTGHRAGLEESGPADTGQPGPLLLATRLPSYALQTSASETGFLTSAAVLAPS